MCTMDDTCIPMEPCKKRPTGLSLPRQAFSIASPAWVKFLQLRFMNHYGNEPVCALNELSVFGKSAVEDLEVCSPRQVLFPELHTCEAAMFERPHVLEHGRLPALKRMAMCHQQCALCAKLTTALCSCAESFLQDRLALDGDADGGGSSTGAEEVERLAAAAAEAGLNAADAAAAAAAVIAAEGAARGASGVAEGRPAGNAPDSALDGGAKGASQTPLAEPPLPAQAAAAEQSRAIPAPAIDTGNVTGREGSGALVGGPESSLEWPNEARGGPDAAAGLTPPSSSAPDASQGKDHGPAEARGALPLPQVPPVLETLGKGLRALVAPPGMGRMRELFSADSADPEKPLEKPAPGSAPQSPEPPRSEPAPQPTADLSAVEGPPPPFSLQNAGNLVGVLPPSGGSSSASDGNDSHGPTDVSRGVPAGMPAQPVQAMETDPQAPRQPPLEGPPRVPPLVPPQAPPQASAPSAPAPAAGPPADDLTLTPSLAGNSAGSARARHSGSVYDALIAEIKARLPDPCRRKQLFSRQDGAVSCLLARQQALCSLL